MTDYILDVLPNNNIGNGYMPVPRFRIFISKLKVIRNIKKGLIINYEMMTRQSNYIKHKSIKA